MKKKEEGKGKEGGQRKASWEIKTPFILSLFSSFNGVVIFFLFLFLKTKRLEALGEGVLREPQGLHDVKVVAPRDHHHLDTAVLGLPEQLGVVLGLPHRFWRLISPHCNHDWAAGDLLPLLAQQPRAELLHVRVVNLEAPVCVHRCRDLDGGQVKDPAKEKDTCKDSGGELIRRS